MRNHLTKRSTAAVAAGLLLITGPALATSAIASPATHSAPATQSATAQGQSWSYTGTWTDKHGRTGVANVSIVPQKFWNDSGKLMMRSAVTTTLQGARGSAPHTNVMDLQVKDVTSGGSASTVNAATCNILNLVLGPLDLNLLGLQVHLNQVVLNIVATSGAGQLLGNLLCAVAGLLDGGTLLGQLSTLLNQILGILNGLGL